MLELHRDLKKCFQRKETFMNLKLNFFREPVLFVLALGEGVNLLMSVLHKT